MRCLWLTADRPGQTTTGGEVYSIGLARSLAEAGVEVEGLCLGPGDDVDGGGVRWQTVGTGRRGRGLSVLSPLPSMTFATAPPSYRSEVHRRLGAGAPDAVIIDHLQMGWAASAVRRRRADRRRRPAIVYCSQNHEEAVRREVADAAGGGPVRRGALWLDTAKATRLERRLLATADLVTCITDEDRCSMERWRVGPLVVVPPGYAGGRVSERTLGAATPRRAVILGSLMWHVKQANLEAFLRVADPAFAAVGAEIVVAGAAPPGFTEGLSRSLRATTMLGFVADVPALLDGARLGIVAEPMGGGFKMKSLDYVFHRVPVAALAGSLAGLPIRPGEDYLEFTTMEDLVSGALVALDDLPLLNRLQAHAFDACGPTFDWVERGRTLTIALQDAIHRSDGDGS